MAFGLASGPNAPGNLWGTSARRPPPKSRRRPSPTAGAERCKARPTPRPPQPPSRNLHKLIAPHRCTPRTASRTCVPRPAPPKRLRKDRARRDGSSRIPKITDLQVAHRGQSAVNYAATTRRQQGRLQALVTACLSGRARNSQCSPSAHVRGAAPDRRAQRDPHNDTSPTRRRDNTARAGPPAQLGNDRGFRPAVAHSTSIETYVNGTLLLYLRCRDDEQSCDERFNI